MSRPAAEATALGVPRSDRRGIMPLTLAQRYALHMHKVPVAPIERALRVVETEALPVTFDQM
jgi:hypothetical protein